MTTEGSSDVLVVPREPTGNTPVGDDGHGKSDSTSGTSRTRKKVTFDLDLQVRTIPQRIPIYERRPAYNNSGHLIPAKGAGQSYAFVPRPLDIRTRDRYLIGAANLSAKRIIDLFSVPNGFPIYPAPPKGHTRPGQPAWRRQSAGYGAGNGGKSARHPAYAFNNSSSTSAKMSRAAANLKQITAALGEHFDSSVYQEWDSTSASHTAVKGGAGSQRGKESPDSDVVSCSTVSLIPPRPYTPTTKAKPTLAYRHRLNPKLTPSPSDSSVESTRVPSAGSSRSTSGVSRKLPAVSSDHFAFGESQLIISKAPANQRLDSRRRSDSRIVSSGRDRERMERSSSRCSTIDTYVISEPSESDNSGIAASTSSRTTGQRIGSCRKMTPTPPGMTRSLAWEGSDSISTVEPTGPASNMRASKPGQTSYGSTTNLGQSNWHVSSKTLNR